jgi:flagellar hook protein FlgE
MMRSLYSGISGLRNHQTRMDVIGNNIANVNTIGYKSSRTIFQDIFSQTSRSGSSNQDFVGGTNPIQIGLGIVLSAIDVMHTQSAFQRSDNPFDAMINGDGYFIVQGPEGNFYTRAGNFKLDEAGYLTNSSGYYVMGYANTNLFVVEETYWDYTLDTPAEVGYMPPRYAIKSFTEDPANPGEYILGDGDDLDVVRPELDTTQLSRLRFKIADIDLTATSVGDITSSIDPADYAADGTTTPPRNTGWRVVDPTVQAAPEAYADETYTPPPFTGVDLLGFSISSSGEVIAIINNVKTTVGQLVLGMFSNPGGLEKAGDSLYRESPSSGAVVQTTAQQNGSGAIMGGGLEMSNVDLASEFTDMIVTQRGFQANSRIITVSDTLLEELVNLKR